MRRLVDELERWLDLDSGGDGGDKAILFHTFSNTGWLTYGAVLQRLRERHGERAVAQICGCVVDSAPAPDPDPRIWASGFSAALLKKRSAAVAGGGDVRVAAAARGTADVAGAAAPRPDAVESALRVILEQFFAVFLQLPSIKMRLAEVTEVLAREQPMCPQLYIYSTADAVIPARSVEAFMATQRAGGRRVLARKLDRSPHVDHLRTYPDLYTAQLRTFLSECLPDWGGRRAAPPPAATSAVVPVSSTGS
eukprot:SM000250S08724  [mRNA]  locus=s250:37521:38689:- [translate_table: standard]